MFIINQYNLIKNYIYNILLILWEPWKIMTNINYEQGDSQEATLIRWPLNVIDKNEQSWYFSIYVDIKRLLWRFRQDTWERISKKLPSSDRSSD